MININEDAIGSSSEREALLKGRGYKSFGAENFYEKSVYRPFVNKAKRISWTFRLDSLISSHKRDSSGGGRVVFVFGVVAETGTERFFDPNDHVANFMRSIYHKLSSEQVKANLDLSNIGINGYYRILFEYSSEQGHFNNFTSLLRWGDWFLNEGLKFLDVYIKAINKNNGVIPKSITTPALSSVSSSTRPVAKFSPSKSKVGRAVPYSKKLRR